MGTADWVERIKKVEGELLSCVEAAISEVEPLVRTVDTITLAKQNVSGAIRRHLLRSGLRVSALPSGNADVPLLFFENSVIIKVKGLDRFGRPSFYPTKTALKYVEGEPLLALPPVPRVDLSYALERDSHEVQYLALIEWADRRNARVVYRLPYRDDPGSLEEALGLPLRGPTITPRELPKRADDVTGTDA